MPITQIVTHDGRFHADDLLSAHVLMTLFPSASLLRTRDHDLVGPAPGRVVADVGGRYQRDLCLYDHHQASRPLRPGSHVPYSAFGLIWRDYGAAYLFTTGVEQDLMERVHVSVDEDFVLLIDLLDNRCVDLGDHPEIARGGLSAMIERLNPTFLQDRSKSAEDAAFRRASEVMGIFLQGSVASSLARIRACDLVAISVREQVGNEVLVLRTSLDHQSALHDLGADGDHVKLIVSPDRNGWSVCTRRVHPAGF